MFTSLRKAMASMLLLILCLPPTLIALNFSKRIEKRDMSKGNPDDWKLLWYTGYTDYQKLDSPMDNNTVTNVTAQLGSTAYLNCPGKNVEDRGQISWVRRRDWHILSSGLLTFTNDERFQILPGENADDWTLQIKYVQKRDNGTYECQISTGTGTISHYVNLNIVVPEALILGSGEHHVETGSVINLVCIIEKSPTPPQYVFWYHNDRMINYDMARGGITVETEPGTKSQSKLTIKNARDTDSGNYTCTASNTEPASIFVFVSEGVPNNDYGFYRISELGDKMAAILRRKNSAVTIMPSISNLVKVFALLVIILIR